MSSIIRQLTRSEMTDAALVHRSAFDDRLPWLAGLHTTEQDQAYFAGQVFAACEVWGAWNGAVLTAIIAFRGGWVDQLYVLPSFQGRGLGSQLLDIAKARNSELRLWAFQRNDLARNFYEARGFSIIEMTDGSRNEEREPDILYRWHR